MSRDRDAALLAEVEAEDGFAGQPGMQSLVRGLRILGIVGASERGLRFTEILQDSGIPKGTLHRLLQTLLDERYLRLDARDQIYRLGPGPFELAHRVWDQFDLRAAAEPELLRLRDLVGETVRLGVLDDGSLLYIDQRENPQMVRLAGVVGQRVGLHGSALGKAIAAHMGLVGRHGLLTRAELPALTGNTLVDPATLEKELNLVRARGYALSLDELHDGVSAVAAPILDHRAEPLGAIGIVGPSYRLGADALHALGREVIEAARRISGNIGEQAMSISINPRPLGAIREDVRVAIPGSDFLAEGPFWSVSEARLHWVDILAPAVVSGDPATGSRQMTPMPELVGSIVPRASGGFLLATSKGFRAWGGEGQPEGLTTIADPEADRPGNRFNDGKCDRAGRFWAGSLSMDTAPGQGALWRLSPDGSVRRMADGFHVANGLGWSPDNRRFYFTDSGRRTIWVHDFDLATGEIENRRAFVTLPEGAGVPDGLTVDSEGFVWSAHWDGWCISRYDPDGRVERVINLPVPRPTSCCFGGPDLSTLHVTSARIRLSAQQLAEAPWSGSVLAVDVGVKGLPEPLFGG